ncbi:MAG: hypothetical protein IJ418_05275 [Clostridia bacterium]|nr:hypothetical protein [Clostridia bacterium]
MNHFDVQKNKVPVIAQSTEYHPRLAYSKKRGYVFGGLQKWSLQGGLSLTTSCVKEEEEYKEYKYMYGNE